MNLNEKHSQIAHFICSSDILQIIYVVILIDSTSRIPFELTKYLQDLFNQKKVCTYGNPSDTLHVQYTSTFGVKCSSQVKAGPLPTQQRYGNGNDDDIYTFQFSYYSKVYEVCRYIRHTSVEERGIVPIAVRHSFFVPYYKQIPSLDYEKLSATLSFIVTIIRVHISLYCLECCINNAIQSNKEMWLW